MHYKQTFEIVLVVSCFLQYTNSGNFEVTKVRVLLPFTILLRIFQFLYPNLIKVKHIVMFYDHEQKRIFSERWSSFWSITYANTITVSWPILPLCINNMLPSHFSRAESLLLRRHNLISYSL